MEQLGDLRGEPKDLKTYFRDRVLNQWNVFKGLGLTYLVTREESDGSINSGGSSPGVGCYGIKRSLGLGLEVFRFPNASPLDTVNEIQVSPKATEKELKFIQHWVKRFKMEEPDAAISLSPLGDGDLSADKFLELKNVFKSQEAV